MAFENIFKTASSIAISTFSKEQGLCTYHQKLSDSSYDALTGITAPSVKDHNIYITFVGLDNKEVIDLPNRAAHRKALISGKDLLVLPQKGDTITDTNGILLYVSRVKTDNYYALFTCYVKEQNEG